uniref:Uncharacterized protein n=1 Tax=Macrostomum lignano TaxID=282301 RepID=A0A1I8FZZ5_9PLAT
MKKIAMQIQISRTPL